MRAVATTALLGAANGEGTESLRIIIAPLLVVGTVIVLLLVYFIRERIRERNYLTRVTEGRCVICGYDLRGEHENCPECGAPVGRKPNPGHR